LELKQIKTRRRFDTGVYALKHFFILWGRVESTAPLAIECHVYKSILERFPDRFLGWGPCYSES